MIGALLIVPSDPDWLPSDSGDLAGLLNDLGLTGAPLEGRRDPRWRAGERFLDHVCFLGCSPSIELEPTTDGAAFCHVRLHLAPGAPVLIRGERRRPPRCPACRAAQPGSLPVSDAPPWRCAACGAELGLADLDWGASAGVARCFIVLANVFPAEAVPGSELMRTLADHTGVEWRYFYAPVED